MFSEKLATEFGEFTYLSFSTSYMPPLRHARKFPPAIQMDPKAAKIPDAFIGIRTIAGGSPRLVVRMNMPENFRCPVPTISPCFCDSDSFAARGLFPVRDFRHRICGLAPNQLILPILQKANLNRILKATPAQIDVPDAERYSAHCFRRCAAMEMINCGSMMAFCMETVGWSPAAFRSYLQRLKDEEAALRNIPSSITPG